MKQIPFQQFSDLNQAFLARYAPLTREQEQTATPEELTIHNIRYAARIAVTYSNYGEINELLSVVLAGFFRASQTFDPARGTKFITFGMWWGHQTVRKHLEDDNVVRVSSNTHKNINILKQYDTDEDAMADNAMPQTQFDVALEARKMLKLLSMDWENPEDGSPFQVATGEDSMEDVVLEEEKAPWLAEYMDLLLTVREMDIVTRWFGGYTLQMLGDEYGLTRERIRQIKAKALLKLQNPKNSQARKMYQEMA